MLRMIAWRLAGLVVTLLAVSVAVFLVMDVLPGDPAAIMLGTSVRPDTLAALRLELGLDRPLPLRFAAWIGGVLAGDLGTSTTYGVPVAGLILDRLAVTLPLALMAIVLSIALALPLGILAASRRGSAWDVLATGAAQIGVATPNFWVGILLILVFASTLGIMPSGGFPGWDAGILPALAALTLPAVALALPQAGVLTRVTRSAVLDVLHEDFVRTARAKGLTRRAALWRHAVPNALLPVVTVIGLQFTFLIAGAVLVENVFGLPGLGRLAFQALQQRDLIVMQDVVLLMAALVIVVNFLVDLSYLVLDPRLRASA
ncbi:ABC transporter permease [Aurantimonas endophytica]|uniref:Peptide/nickel transport system permease protein n=1 Tax=Aurantimonas endophytica TaxID=1522175 RepID=A0A7W6HF83_9HYPH|nr:ABC transporter permease [Aurantimonas endophytica]MBB4003912.1 peptide/nickel transport system permease protein [Aurantimonas endophytica]MCO6404763.1 ABC transporter permease subunit [Aurantimonas endophytica]